MSANPPYLHDLEGFPDLIQIVATELGIIPQLVEKDYWIMHCLHVLTVLGFVFELKGGTSLSKGFGIIERFSEDIDIHIDPVAGSVKPPFSVFTGKNQIKKAVHINSRKNYYDWLAENIVIDGVESVERDTAFDDEDFYRNGGIRLNYKSHYDGLSGLKDGILLEVGFDDTAPNSEVDIASWAYKKAGASSIAFFDNCAKKIKCYHPGYTFVEKLQTVSTKYRQQRKSGDFPVNFMRHYYDLAKLLDHADVQSFIGTPEYHERKKVRFRIGDNLNISENDAFLIADTDVRETYKNAFDATRSLYYCSPPDFDEILNKIQEQAVTL
ncbi:MAG: nucleotidyl transferase AbiEii/AbiGii toxin family protein [Gammaproteobacteria bacterium]|nr:nucleotidyl transferase AbiEii/AbiGii toxin family protein [Gammaproteobacteria bacterium]